MRKQLLWQENYPIHPVHGCKKFLCIGSHTGPAASTVGPVEAKIYIKNVCTGLDKEKKRYFYSIKITIAVKNAYIVPECVDFC